MLHTYLVPGKFIFFNFNRKLHNLLEITVLLLGDFVILNVIFYATLFLILCTRTFQYQVVLLTLLTLTISFAIFCITPRVNQ